MGGIMNIRRKDGVTLLELIIAMALSVLVMSAASAMYLSGNNIAKETINSAQAPRNAQIVLMHMQKNICNAATEFNIENNIDLDGIDGNNDKALNYRQYGADPYGDPSVMCRYEFIKSSREIVFMHGANNTVVGRHIEDCIFTEDGVMLSVGIAALDNNDNPASAYTLNTWVEATGRASDAVFF